MSTEKSNQPNAFQDLLEGLCKVGLTVTISATIAAAIGFGLTIGVFVALLLLGR